jgi:hypothetical protein
MDRSVFKEILAQFSEYRFIGEELARLIVHNEDVDSVRHAAHSHLACRSQDALSGGRVTASHTVYASKATTPYLAAYRDSQEALQDRPDRQHFVSDWIMVREAKVGAIIGIVGTLIVAGAAIFGYVMYLTSGYNSERRESQPSILKSGEDMMPIRCSRCKSIRIRRSKRKGIEKGLSLIFIRPYRSRDCYHRFFHKLGRADEHRLLKTHRRDQFSIGLRHSR